MGEHGHLAGVRNETQRVGTSDGCSRVQTYDDLLHKENRNMKDDLDYIRSKYGTVAEIKQKMEIAEMKENHNKIMELAPHTVYWAPYEKIAYCMQRSTRM